MGSGTPYAKRPWACDLARVNDRANELAETLSMVGRGLRYPLLDKIKALGEFSREYRWPSKT
jgi:hypothetical protein